MEKWFEIYCKTSPENPDDPEGMGNLGMGSVNPNVEKAAQYIAEDELKMRQDLARAKKELEAKDRTKKAYEARLKDAMVTL